MTSIKRECVSELNDIFPKKKISIKQTPEEEAKAKEYFQSHVFEPSFKNKLKDDIQNSKPYRWGTIKNLINDELLRNVRNEIISEIEFTKKETDIYKVFQSGDLANLSAMPPALLKKLPSIYKLRSAIYSETFRSFISDITGCGKLSGIKTDLSIQLYTKGCHLLTHDDVIGSRRVSFILYMPDPDSTWKNHHGGGLQLFDSLVPNVPQSDVHSKLVPNFNQIAFFEVQPGLSFHAVEEVKVDRQRLSLQGWFHIPQFGEDGYIPGEQEKTERLSTLKQLESKELKEFDFPKFNFYKIDKKLTLAQCKLDEADHNYLTKFMNPSLLTNESISKLSKIFDDESVVDIYQFLNADYEKNFKNELKNFELNEYPKMPAVQKDIEYPWKLAIPSHKQRYMYIDGLEFEDITTAESISQINKTKSKRVPSFQKIQELFESKTRDIKKDVAFQKSLEENPNFVTNYQISSKLCQLAEMFKSKSFNKWLSLITRLKLVKNNTLIRRFRPGTDFILATKNTGGEEGDEEETGIMDGLLESTLNLTPSYGWDGGELGGYELCLIDDDDAETEDISELIDKEKANDLNEDEAAIYKKADKDSIVYEGQANWNKLSLMYRDPSIMKFVKYVSYESNGSRWDINSCWKCVDESE